MEEKRKKKSKLRMSKKSKLTISVLFVLSAILLIVFTAAQNLGNMTVNTMVADVKAYFMSLGAGDGYPYDIDAGSVRDIKINNSNIYLMLSDKTTTLNSTAKEIMPQAHTYSNPAMKSKNSNFIIYDLDSNRFRIQQNTEIKHEGEASGRIMAAAIGKKSNYALGTYGDSVQSVLTVYDKNNEAVFIWNFKSERITDISLSDNGKFAAVSTIDALNGEINSKLYVFDFKSEDYVSCFDYNGTTLVKVDYVRKTDIVAIGDNLRSCILGNTERQKDYVYGSDQLSGYSVTDDGRSTLVLSRYGSAALSKLNVYSKKNEQEFSLNFEKEVKWADSDEKYTAVLFETEVITYNKKGEKLATQTFEGEPIRVAVDGKRTYVLTTSGLQCFKTKGE
ncbi:MAG: DUF5711 family protein [Acutalibacteraceae bacterium]|nr:DUF5711 family protein [Acutalibacteraceae bacterium]